MSMPQADTMERPTSSKYDRLLARAKQVPPAKTIVVHPCDESSLRAAIEAAEAGIIVPTLVGPAKKILEVARDRNFNISRFEVVDAPHSDAAAAKAVQLIHEAKGELLMKGSLHTDELMRAVTASSTGLRTGSAHQPRLYRGCSELFGDAFPHRRGHQYLPGPRCEA